MGTMANEVARGGQTMANDVGRGGHLSFAGMGVDEANLQAVFGGDVSIKPFLHTMADFGPHIQPFQALSGTPQVAMSGHMFPLTPAPSPLAFNSVAPNGLPNGIEAPQTPVSVSPSPWIHRLPHSLSHSPQMNPRPIDPQLRPSPVPIKSKMDPEASPRAVIDTNCNDPEVTLTDGPESTTKKPRKRRCFRELIRDVQCKHEGCGRVYATESSLQTHIRLKHNNVRPEGLICPSQPPLRKSSTTTKPPNSSKPATSNARSIRTPTAKAKPGIKGSSLKRSASVATANPCPLPATFASLSADRAILGTPPIMDMPLRSASEPGWGLGEPLASIIDFDAASLLEFGNIDAYIENLLDFGPLDTQLAQMTASPSDVDALIFAM